MRAGRAFRRCNRCSRRFPDKAKRCICGHDAFTWAAVIDTAPNGAKRRQRRRQGFPTKAAALAWIHDTQHKASTGTLVERSKDTTATYLRDWLESVRPPAIRPGTWESYRIHVESYIVPVIGDIRLQELARTDVKRLYAKLATSGRIRGEGGLSPKTTHNVHITLRRALEMAVDDGLLARNPAAKAHKAPEHVERDTWPEEALRAFLAHVSDHRLSALWRLAAMSGMRRGELLALRWPDMDVSAAVVRVVRTRGKGEGGAVFEGPPKTARGRRTIDIDPETAAALRRHRTRQLEERMRIPSGYSDLGYVFCREDGEPFHPDAISDNFERQCRAAGVPPIGLHAALRHLHGSVLLRQGVPLHVVSRRLGHANEAFTARVYAHVLPGQGAEAAAAAALAIDR